MTMTLPDNANFYTSPLHPDLQAAIGRLIICWAAVEASLPLQVARMVAASPSPEVKEIVFNHAAFVKACAVGGGAGARATLAQIQNLIHLFSPEKSDIAKKHADILLKKKQRRDDLSHLSAMQGKNKDTIRLQVLSASKSSMWQEKFYTIKEIDGWTHDIKSNARALDSCVSEITGWTWARIAKEYPLFLQVAPASAE